MKDPSSLTDAELAIEIENLQRSRKDPDRLEALENEALGRAYEDR